MPDHVRRGHVVRDAIYPRTQRAIAREPFEAAPDGEVNVLQEIAALVAIEFIRARQPLERRAEFAGSLLVQHILRRHQPKCPSERGSRRKAAFLTFARRSFSTYRHLVGAIQSLPMF